MEEQPNESVARLAAEAAAQGDAVGWFDQLYAMAEGDPSRVPWADQKPNPWLVEWLAGRGGTPSGSTAVVVGCGLGDDAEELARLGYEVTGFDVAPNAIEWARRRFPDSLVDYRVADLFDLPPVFEGAYDFVFEAYTLQPLPEGLRGTAIAQVASLAAPGGSVLVVTRGRQDNEPVGGPPPWPLSPAELRGFERAGLMLDSFDDFIDDKRDMPIRRFRVHYLKPAAS